VLAIGLMSGTSADGIDAALVELGTPEAPWDGAPGRPVHLRAFVNFAYPDQVREELFTLFGDRTGSTSLVCRLNFVLGELFARAALAAAEAGGAPLESIEFIASHGQTVWHQPEPETVADVRTRSSLQLGEPAVIAERTGCTVVANLRARDMAAGGQGAPLAPYVDYLLLTDPHRPRIAQNIGGIANLTYLPPGGRPEEVIAFDTGPGNAPIDAAVAFQSQGQYRYDVDGERAAKGTVNENLLSLMLQHEYLEVPPPKSTGRELFGAVFAEGLHSGRGRDDGLIATLTRFTVESIALSYERWLPPLTPETEIVLSGGGARNPTLVAWLRERVRPAQVRLSDEFGLPIDAKEAMLFAVLGAETLRGAPGNLPSATGAAHPVVLGQVVPGRGWPHPIARGGSDRARTDALPAKQATGREP
jgi:anhydro-N-acetylmuramic acid kinase